MSIEGRTGKGKGNRKADGDGISRNDAETLKSFAHWRTTRREGYRVEREGGTDEGTFEFLGRRGHGIGICLPACRKLVTAAVSVVAHKEREGEREGESERARERGREGERTGSGAVHVDGKDQATLAT